MCDTQAFKSDMLVQDSVLSKEDVALEYGSASLKGKMFTDKVCIDPMGERCAENF